MRKKWFSTMLWFGVGLFLAYVFLCFRLANSVVSPPRIIPTKPLWATETEVLPGIVAWTSKDYDKRKTAIIFSHGLGGNRSAFEFTAERFAKEGFGVILLPMPGQDVNPEPTIGFGTAESRLIKKVIDKLPNGKIALVGVSMGGAASWMASDHPRVSAVITEGAYSRLEPVTKEWLKAKMAFGDILFAPVIWIATAKLGLKAADINPVQYAKSWKGKPALIIQAENDSLIPRGQSQELAIVTGTELWLVPNVSHANCQNNPNYSEKLLKLLNRL